MSSRPGRALAALARIAFVGVALLMGLYDLLISAWKCDESCGRHGETSWGFDADAWQWDVIGVGALVSFITVVLFIALTAKGKMRAALVLAGLYLAFQGSLVVLWTTSGQ